jgi:hypothetical protein
VRATKTTTVKRAFVLHPDQIRRIADTVQEHGGNCSFKVECAGDLTLNPSSMDELLSVPNVGDYRIKSLGISSWGGGASASVDVTFYAEGSAGWASGPIRICMSGDDSDVVKTHDRLMREIVIAAKQRWLAILDPDDLFGDLVLFVVFLPISGLAALLFFLGSKTVFPTSLSLVFAILVYGVCSAVGSSAFRRAASWAYPKGIFLIGSGKQEYEDIRSRRQLVTISYWVVGLGIAVVGWLITAVVNHWLRL